VIVDASALIAILREEPDARRFTDAIADADNVKISAATLFEASIVADGIRDHVAGRRFDDICRDSGLLVVPFDAEQARIAREAYREYGKGSGHKARLNFGDCFAYALARVTGELLLYKGTDFQHTDVTSALP
jgi:ribonuclease VapC